MAVNSTEAATMVHDPGPMSWTMPNERDDFAVAGLITLMFVVFLVIYLYAVFDRFAESEGFGSPLRTTIPTMLTIGLAYDIIPPLSGVSNLLPLALILAAVARDISLWVKSGLPQGD